MHNMHKLSHKPTKLPVFSVFIRQQTMVDNRCVIGGQLRFITLSVCQP